jgi:site-specific recombinase XerD
VENGIRTKHEILVISPVKTRKGFRKIPLEDDMLALFEEQHQSQQEEYHHAGDLWQGDQPGADDMYVFTTAVGTVIQNRNMRRFLDEVTNECGLPHISIHPLRHSMLTELGHSGADPKTVAEIGGHENVCCN